MFPIILISIAKNTKIYATDVRDKYEFIFSFICNKFPDCWQYFFKKCPQISKQSMKTEG